MMVRLRPVLRKFAERCEQRLRANDFKGGWQKEDVLHLLSRCREELRELTRAVGEGLPPEKIAGEAADVANFAMMIADVCGGLPLRRKGADCPPKPGESFKCGCENTGGVLRFCKTHQPHLAEKAKR